MADNAPGLSSEWAEFKDRDLRVQVFTINQFLSVIMGVGIAEDVGLAEVPKSGSYDIRVPMMDQELAWWEDPDASQDEGVMHETIGIGRYGMRYAVIEGAPPVDYAFRAGFGESSRLVITNNVPAILVCMSVYNIMVHRHNERVKRDEQD